MLSIQKERFQNQLTLNLEGRLDSNSAPELDMELKTDLVGITRLVWNLFALSYLSSAGLRVILSAQKQMNAQGEMVVTGVNETIMDIFTMTGFADILTIQ
ncbi:MAG: STAS domain-containing protein [Clostridiaceae bacterium]